MTENPREARILRHTENAIERLTPENRRIVRRLVVRRSNAGIRASSNQNFVFALRHADAILAGKPLDRLDPGDVEDAVHGLKQRLGEATAFIAVRQLQRALTLLSEDGKLAPRVKAALQQRRHRQASNHDRIIEVHEFQAMLEAGRNHRCGRTTFAPDLSVAIQWVLWDGGPRAHEALATLNEGVKLNADGTVELNIPDAPLCKTGARTIVLAEAGPALKAWLTLHPAGNNPKAPLFPGFYDKTGLVPMTYESLRDHLATLSHKVGLPAAITPHDYRHTCATRKARAGWVESQLRLFFGWSKDSKMPSHYVNMGLDDLRARVRADVGKTPTGFASVQPASDAERLAQLLKRIAHGQPTRTPAPTGELAPPR